MILALYGAGAMGREFKLIADASGEWSGVVFIDDHADVETLAGCPVLRFQIFRAQYTPEEARFVVAIGEPKFRREAFEKMTRAGYRGGVLVHGSASVSPDAGVGEGTAVCQGVYIGSQARIGKNCYLSVNAIVGHDAVVGDHTRLGVNAFVGGHTEIGENAFIVVYGQSEATAAISCLPAERALDKPGSVGAAIPGGSIELIDAEGNAVEGPHIPGELVYRGENVALGYATRGEDLGRGDDWRGVLRTGDIAERDEDGYLYITGRIKRFIKMAGHRISLDEIDEKIMNEIHIRCVSSGVDDHLVIFVLSDGDGDAVRDFIRRKLSVVRTGCKVVTIDAFPTNEAGKVLYGGLLEMAKRA